jgi:hypothetical protein
LSLLRELDVALVDEHVARLVSDSGEVEFERESLLEAVALVHVDGVDAVERLLRRSNDPQALGSDRLGDNHGLVVQRLCLDA